MKRIKTMKRNFTIALLAACAAFCAAAKDKIVVVPAHPDDLIPCFGTCLLTKDVFEWHVIEFTHGERGLGEAVFKDGSCRKIRMAEEEAVCNELGATLHWLDEIDGEAYACRETCERLAELLKELKPRAVFVHGHGKAIAMLAAAAAMLVAGLVWSKWMPINKKLWTSTFVLVSGAYSLALFAAFYWIVDVKMWRGWAFLLRVVGMNAITIYLLQRVVDFDATSRFFLGGVAGLLPQDFGAALISLGHLAVCWLVLWFLYRKNVFMKV